MHLQQLQQRLASSSQASCSYAAARPAAAAAVPLHRGTRSAPVLQRSPPAPHRQLVKHVCRAAAAAPAEDGGDDADDSSSNSLELAAAEQPQQIALDPRNDTVYDSMTFASNTTPDYDDPYWVEKVDDWEEFWFSTEGEELEFEEDLSPAERSEASLERAQRLVGQLADLRTRADVEHMITGEVRPHPFYEDTYKSEAEMVDERRFYSPDPNPHYDAIDLRALSEKRAARGALDAEWKQREALLARPFSYTLRLDNDARLQSSEFDWVREEWTHEQIMDLIVGSGKFVHPDKVKATILNPLLGMDFHNDVRVHVVPETEEFIERIGHMATEEDIAYLQSASEIQLHTKDFVDPTMVFEDLASGAQYVDAPPNPWAEMKKAEDARDLELFSALVEKVASRQRRREAAAAAGADGAEGGYEEGEYEEAEYDPDDDNMGDGFRLFYARDEDNEAGLLMYEDELDGQLSDSDFYERDEAEEGEEGEDGDEAEEGGQESNEDADAADG